VALVEFGLEQKSAASFGGIDVEGPDGRGTSIALRVADTRQ